MSLPFSVVGQPRAERLWMGRDDSDANAARFVFGKFSLKATLRVQPPSQGTLGDWQAGIVQMVSGPIDTNCYQRHGDTNHVFVDQPGMVPRQFYPDRDPVSALFVHAGTSRDLAWHRAGDQFELESNDHPGFRAPAFASQITGDVGQHGDVHLKRHLHRGFFYTYLVAHHKSTGALHPVYMVQWFLGVTYEFVWPGQGIQLTPDLKLRRFEIISEGLFRDSDFRPVTDGPPMNELTSSRVGSRRRFWTNRLLDFHDHIVPAQSA
jgi:hypothetical protein